MVRTLTISPAAALRYACAWDTGATVPQCSARDCAGCPHNPWAPFMGPVAPPEPALRITAVVAASRLPRRRQPVRAGHLAAAS